LSKKNEKNLQAEVNLGLIGHVDHGKSTLVESLAGVFPDTYEEELRRGISIYLGYANADFRKCPSCEEPECYTTEKTCPIHKKPTKLLRRVSFVDAPGHERLMATMLTGAAIMDGAILVIAANEPVPQAQTREHLAAAEISDVNHIVVTQNKIELVNREAVANNYQSIKDFIDASYAKGAPIIPISAMHKANLDVLIQVIEETIPTPKRDPSLPAEMYVARSFDTNRPGTRPKKLVGGVVGGTMTQGKLKVGDEIEIVPGLRSSGGTYEPLITEVVSLSAGGGSRLKVVKPGGLIGVQTLLDPALTKRNRMVGNLVGKPGTLPPAQDSMVLDVHLLERLVSSAKMQKIKKIEHNESLMLNAGTTITVGDVTSVRNNTIELTLRRPVATRTGDRVAISRQIERWSLIGYGVSQ